jgi:DNA-binding MarR family transcriptional regulator
MLLYNPDRKGKEQLINEFVVRQMPFREIMEDIESADPIYPGQNYILVGPRGAGKTTLLNRIKYGIEDSAKLNKRLIPVIFQEEQYNISELSDLWQNIGEYLEDYYGFAGIGQEMKEMMKRSNFEELCYDILERWLDNSGRGIVLLLDKIGDLFKKIGELETRRLREILITKKQIRLIGGSAFYPDTILDYADPMFEFFKVIRLEGLNRDETRQLLLKLGQIYNEEEKIRHIIQDTPERIDTLSALTDGVPRTIVLMFRIFTDYNDENAVKDLERILDAVTPLFKHRMDDLPAQQQKIVDAVARNWDAISIRDLKEKVRIDGKNISAQLRQLEKNGVIEKRNTETKNHLYLLRERFFNIWYLMRFGRRDEKQRVIWLVKFLESWCSKNDIKERIFHYVEMLKNGRLDERAIQLFGETYAAIMGTDLQPRLLLKESTPRYISKAVVVSNEELVGEMRKLNINEDWERILELAYITDLPDTPIKLMIYIAVTSAFVQNKDRKVLDRIFSKLTSKKIEELEGRAAALRMDSLILKSVAYNFLGFSIAGSPEKIFHYFERIIDLTDESDLKENTFESAMLTEFICLMLSKKYYNVVYNIFKEIKKIDLGNLLKPVYYTCILLKDGKDSTEYLSSGPELDETVQEILQTVHRYEKTSFILNDTPEF